MFKNRKKEKRQNGFKKLFYPYSEKFGLLAPDALWCVPVLWNGSVRADEYSNVPEAEAGTILTDWSSALAVLYYS